MRKAKERDILANALQDIQRRLVALAKQGIITDDGTGALVLTLGKCEAVARLALRKTGHDVPIYAEDNWFLPAKDQWFLWEVTENR